MSADTITRTCPCGTPVTVEPVEGFGAKLMESVGVVCARCAEDRKAQDEREERARKAAELQCGISRRRGEAGVPFVFQGCGTWANLPELDPSVRNALMHWARGNVKGIVLTGPVGVGKTFAAAVAAWDYLTRKPLVWTSAPLLFARLGSGLGSAQHQQALEILTSRKALVLDDLDKARPTEYGAEQVFLAVDQRVTTATPLLVTTNLDLIEIANRFAEPYGEALASRLAGYCEVHKIAGRDRRLDATGGKT